MRVSQSDLVQCFYLHYNLPDIFMDFFSLIFLNGRIFFKNIQLLITTIVKAVLIVMAV